MKTKLKDLEVENVRLKTEALEKEKSTKLSAEELRSKIQKVYEGYKTMLGVFGAEPYDLPSALNAEIFLSWLLDEFGSLSEVISAAQDNCAMICCDGFAKLIEYEAP